MGTTLHAIVEAFSPGEEYEHADGSKGHTVDRWWEIATWEFNKNYALSMCLESGRGAMSGWPSDSSALKGDEYEYCDERRQWCTLRGLERAYDTLQHQRAATAKDVDWVDVTNLSDKEEDSGPYDWEVEAIEPLLAALRVLDKKGTKTRILWYRM